MKIPSAKAAVDKEWAKLEKISPWNLTKVKSKKQVIDEARTAGATVHFASLMDLCHLKNSELEPQFQRYRGRVVLRGDTVEDDSGANAVFSEQGSSASQMTGAKVMDVIARLPDCDGQAADAISAWRMLKNYSKSPKSECPDVWIRLPKHTWPKSWEYIEDPVVPLERNLYGHPLAGLLWERQFEKSIDGTWMRRSTELRMPICCLKTWTMLVGVRGWYQYGRKEAECSFNVEENWWKTLTLKNQHHFLITFTWDALNGKANQTRKTIGQHNKMFESRISAGATEKLPGWDQLRAKTSAWSYDMEGHARKCVERYRELANKKTEQLFKVSHPCLDDNQIKKGWIGEQRWILYQNACTWHKLVDLTFCDQSTNWHDLSQNGLKHVTDDWHD